MNEALVHYLSNLNLYGGMVMDEGDVFKGKIIRNIAGESLRRTQEFFNHDDDYIRTNFPAFRDDLLALLNSQNKILATYRRNLATIFKNIAISLTVIGAFVVAAKLLHSKWRTGRTLGFFASPVTTSEIIRNNAINTLTDPSIDPVPAPRSPEL